MRESDYGERAKRSIKEISEALRSEREHLAVQIELGRMELKDEWHELEAKWKAFEQKVDDLGDDAKDAVHRIADEIEEAYGDLKDRLKDR